MNKLMKALVLISALTLSASGSVSASPYAPPAVGVRNNGRGSTDSSSDSTQGTSFALPTPAGSDGTPSAVQPASNGTISNNTASTDMNDGTVPVTADGATNSSSDLAASASGQNTSSTSTNSSSTTPAATQSWFPLNGTDSANMTSPNSTSTNDTTDESAVLSPANVTSAGNSTAVNNGTSSTLADSYGGSNSSASSVPSGTDDGSFNATVSNDTSIADTPAEAINSTTYNNASLASNGTYDTNATSGLSNDTSLTNGTSLYNETLASINGTTPAGNRTFGTFDASGNQNVTSFNSTSNSTGIVGSVRTFVMARTVNWSQSDFKIYDNNGSVAYVIASHDAGVNATTEDFIMTVGSTGEKKAKVNAFVGSCGQRTEWASDDGTKITLDPRGFLSDQWYIKNAVSSQEKYTFLRAVFSLQGDIVENGSGRTVATITEQKIKSALPSLPYSSGDKVFIVTNNGIIADWDLLTMLTLAAQHYQHCHL